jgi:hypothetical protein
VRLDVHQAHALAGRREEGCVIAHSDYLAFGSGRAERE